MAILSYFGACKPWYDFTV